MKSPFTLSCGWIFLLATLLAGCGQNRESARRTAPAVTVSHPVEKSVTDYLDLTGTIVPYRHVDLVARVTGYLESVNFKDGEVVEAGKLLFVIEPEPYQQQLALAQAALLRAQSEYDRQLGLMKENATSAAAVERWLSERDQARAQVELARLNLSYTRVTAPFSGRISRRLVDEGNLVGPGVNTQLATIEQIAPIYASFNLNERDALQIEVLMRQRGRVPLSAVGRAPVFVGLQNQEGYPQQGTLDFLGTGVSTSSGTVEMRAVFDNKDYKLISGAFVRVRIPMSEPQPMLVVPQSALGNDQEGDFVLVADAGDVVTRRAVVKGSLTGSGCAIRSGLSAADRVIVKGMTRAKPGSTVTPVFEPSTKASPVESSH